MDLSIETQRGALSIPLNGNIEAAAERLSGKTYRLATFDDGLNNRG